MTDQNKNLFSKSENKVLNILSKSNQKLTIKQLTQKFYKNQQLPIYARNTMVSVVRRINNKSKYHKLKFFINGRGIGRKGKTVWKDKRGA